jgi:hypothetical protein
LLAKQVGADETYFSSKSKQVGGKLDVKDVIQPAYNEINKKYGLSEKQD